jgi:hypothetical protein
VEEEVSSNEMLMNQLDTSEEKLFVRHAHGMLFDDDGDTTLMSSVPHTPESHQRSNEESSDEDPNVLDNTDWAAANHYISNPP